MEAEVKKPYIDFETKRLHIRSVVPEDNDVYMALRISNSPISAVYATMPEFADYEWNGELLSEDDIYLSVFQKRDGTFVASASIQHFKSSRIEFGYDVVKEYRNRGIATEIVNGLLAEVHRRFPEAVAIIRVGKENAISRRVAEKCGGVMIGNEDSFVDRLIKSNAENAQARAGDLMSDDLMTALELGKDYVCIYEMP